MHRIAISLIALVLTAPAFAQQKVSLEHKYVPGQYVLTMDQRAKTTTSMMGQRIPSDVTMETAAQIDVSKPDDKGNKTIKFTYKRVTQTVDAGGMRMSFDSAKKDQTPSPLASMGKMVGSTITMTVDKDGKVTKVEGVDEMMDKMTEGNPAAAGMMKDMKKQFGPEAMAQMISSSRQFLPEKPVAPGESWTSSATIPMPMIGEAKTEMKNKLTEVKKVDGREMAAIAFEGTTKSEGGEAVGDENVQMKMSSMDIKQKGTVLVDTENPMIQQSTMSQKGTMTMSAGAAQGQEMQMKIEMDGTTRTSVKPGVYKEPKDEDKGETDKAPRAAEDTL
jgi:hypothetical protein